MSHEFSSNGVKRDENNHDSDDHEVQADELIVGFEVLVIDHFGDLVDLTDG